MTEPALHRFRIELHAPGMASSASFVELDGLRLKGVTSVLVEGAANGIPVVTVTMFAQSVSAAAEGARMTH